MKQTEDLLLKRKANFKVQVANSKHHGSLGRKANFEITLTSGLMNIVYIWMLLLKTFRTQFEWSLKVAGVDRCAANGK